MKVPIVLAKTKSRLFGPAILVTAAFIGPGTVMAASLAGAKYGYRLLWAVAFSVFGAIVLQEMASRLGIVTGQGLSEAIKKTFKNPFFRIIAIVLVLLAILVGNAAYQTGNIIGAASGLSVLTEGAAEVEKPTITQTIPSTEGFGLSIWILIIGGLAWLLILIGRFEVLQKVLTVLVVLMSLLFFVAACVSSPSVSGMLAGFVPSIPSGAEWAVIGLIGTTIVPYNLFLHASAAAQNWPPDSVAKTDDKTSAVKHSKRGTILSVIIGGCVTAAILVTAAVAFHSPDGESVLLTNVADVAIQLKPALGEWAKWLFGAGLFAAGLTSAITAPIAAAYAAAGCFGWPNKLSDWRLKAVASAVVLFGIYFAILFGNSPTEVIVLAQVANGILLPVMAIFLLIILNRVSLMHRFRNSMAANVGGVIVLIVVMLMAARSLSGAYKKVQSLMKPAVVSSTVDFEKLQRHSN
jgi:NRAMP (natural resistance-associated macrophage protein)-like metal ion transporter